LPTLHDDFTTLHPYGLPRVRTLARLSGVSLGNNPTPSKIQQLFEVWGSQTAFIQNAPAVAQALSLEGSVLPNEEVLNLLDETGTLDEFGPRTLRNFVTPTGSLIAIVTGATVRWMEYRVKQVVALRNSGYAIDKVFAVASDERRCKQDSEVIHPVVQLLTKDEQPPLEYEALEKLLRNAQLPATFVVGPSLEANIGRLVDMDHNLAHARLYVPTNGNATYIPLAVRRFIRAAEPSFDDRFDQFWFSQRAVTLARTPEQAADPLHYQRPLTVFSGLVRLIYELYLL
jgi:hypothetical protein